MGGSDNEPTARYAPGADPGRRVRVLPDSLANQIAAGEVVERAASVAKELVENALDAGATRIEVEVGSSGRDLTVLDDGCGMGAEDAETALKRFATSKIGALEDLHRVASFGFRGEALPSIASVSRFLLETRAEGGEGRRIEVAGGKLVRNQPAGGPLGTKVTVEDLFYNTPARLKFLKTAATEIRRIVESVGRIAIAAAGVGFKLTVTRDDRRVVAFQVAPFANLHERIGAVLGSEVAREVFPFQGVSNEVTASGYAGSPTLSRSHGRDLLVYVNNRLVKDRTVQAAAGDAYRSLLGHGRHPLAVILLQVPADLVDVNVHPAKVEVRFSRTDDVWKSVHRGLEEALRLAPWARGQSPGRSVEAQPLPVMPTRILPQPPWLAPERSAPGSPSPSPPTTGEEGRIYRLYSERPSAAAGPVTAAEAGVDDDPRRFFRGVRVFGQYRSTYLLGERRGELVVIDQHAAHERVMFEKLRAGSAGTEASSQRLLVPLVVELSAAEARSLSEALPALAAAGIEAEPFGERSLAVRAVPALLSKAEPGRLVRDALEELARRGKIALQEGRETLLARMACHAAVRAGDVLSSEEAAALLAEMDGVDFAANCPHGRPVVVRFPAFEVEKWFDRR